MTSTPRAATTHDRHDAAHQQRSGDRRPDDERAPAPGAAPTPAAAPAPGTAPALGGTERTRLTRSAHREVTDRAALHALLDEALVAHVGVVRDGAPAVLPMGCARDGERLLLHGSTGAGLLREVAGASPVCATVTLLDGLVLARSAFDSSMNYRCAVVHGRATALAGDEKTAALDVITDHLLCGRTAEVRAATARELAATLVLALPLEEASLKVRAGDPSSGEDDPSVWAGVVPLALRAGEPVTAADVPAGVPVPASAHRAAARW